MITSKYRDLTIIDINESQKLVIACDSSGAIGDKENDIIKTRPEIVGYFGAQVSMMELLSFGARPISVIDTLSVEMYPTGERIIKGIKKALEPLNSNIDNIITGSTEENFPVSVTAMGITVLGILEKDKFVYPKTEEEDIAVVVGVPKLGNEILENPKDIMNIKYLIDLKDKKYIKEILPVGSKGILNELNQMGKTNKLNFLLEKEISIDLYKSAGPSTCAIVSLNKNDLERLQGDIDLPVETIASFMD